MPVIHPIQSSFNTGELSPEMYGRVDLAKYAAGCKTLHNMICLPHGPATRRPGTEFIREVKDSSKITSLLPFEFSTTQAYIIESGDFYFNFYKNGGVVQHTATITGATQANPCVITATNRFVEGQSVTISGVVGMTELNGNTYTVSNVTSSQCDLNVDSSGFTAYTSDGEAVGDYEIVSPYPISGSVDFVSNGGFPSNTTGWVEENSTIGSVAGGQAGNCLQITRFSNVHQSAYQLVTGLIVDTSYEVTFYVKEGTVVGERFAVSMRYFAATKWNVLESISGDSTSSWVQYSLTFTAIDTEMRIYLTKSSGTAGTILFDTVTIKEIGVNYGALDITQSADTLYLAHPDFIGRELTRTDHDNWTVAIHGLLNGPWLDQNTTATTLTPSGTTGSINITASAITGINDGAGFLSGDVGRIITILQTATWGIARVDSITSTTIVACTVLTDFLDTSSVATWKLGKWADTVDVGAPRSVTFDNDRLSWGGHPLFPQELYLSKVGIYTDHSAADTPADDDGLELTLGAKKVNAIRWLESIRKLAVGTTTAEHWISNATGDGPITANSKQAVVGSTNGSQQIHPVVVGNTLLYIQNHGRVVRELIFDSIQDTYAGEDLTILSDHLTKDYALTALAFQKSPWKVLWCIRSDGTLLGLTYYKEHEVWGWHQHPMNNGIVESIAVIPGTNEDEVWMIVKRTINGSDVRYVERLHETFKEGLSTDAVDAFYVDSGLTLDNRQTVDSFTQADPGVFTVPAHDLSDNDSVRLRTVDDTVSGEEAYSSLNNMVYTVTNSTGSTFELSDDGGATSIDTTLVKQVISMTVGEQVTAISGLDHLEGESVDILADGIVQDAKTVSSGAITLDTAASVVHVGLGYNSDIETLTPEIELRDGTFQVKTKRIPNVTARLNNSLNFKVGPDADSLKEVDLRPSATASDHPTPLFSDDTDEISIPDGLSKAAQVYIRQDQPTPLTVLGLFTQIES